MSQNVTGVGEKKNNTSPVNDKYDSGLPLTEGYGDLLQVFTW